MEPFKIKSVEHIRITTREERIDALKKANTIKGDRITESSELLKHFSASFEWITTIP